MPWWTWLGLGIFVAAALVSALLLVLSLVGLGRASGRLQRSLDPALASLQHASEELARTGERAAASRGQLARSQARAKASYSGLLVLWDSLAEVRTGLRLLRVALRAR